MANDSQTISFRVSSVTAALLEEQALRENLSRNEYARKLVLAALSGPTAGDLLSELQSLKGILSGAQTVPTAATAPTPGQARESATLLREVNRIHAHINDLRAALATGVTCLLAQAGGVDPKEAEAWVTQHMFPQGK